MNSKIQREKTIRDTKSNLILDAARNAFSKRGYHETRLEDIAIEAGFSKASLYNYYQDKTEIFVSLAIREFDDLLEKLRFQFNPEDTILKNFEKQFREIFNFFGNHFAFMVATTNFRLMCTDNKNGILGPHNDLLNRFKCKFTEIVEMHAEMIGNARKRGEFETPLTDMTIAGYVTSLIRGVVFDWKMTGVVGDIEQEISKLLVFLETGLKCLVK